MNKVVREAYPASKLPEELREGIDAASEVRVTIEELEPPTDVLTLEEIFALRRPPYRSNCSLMAVTEVLHPAGQARRDGQCERVTGRSGAETSYTAD